MGKISRNAINFCQNNKLTLVWQKDIVDYITYYSLLMPTGKRVRVLTILVSLFSLSSAMLVRTPVLADPPTPKALIFVADSMRQDLMLQFAEDGYMPAYEEILKDGVAGRNGMIPNVPANTGPGWTSLITGASPAVTGVTNNTFHDNTVPFSNFGVSAWAAGINQADTLAKQADDEGLTVVSLAWQAFDMNSIPHGAAVEYFPDWLTGRGITANYSVPLYWTGAIPIGPTLTNNIVSLVDATGWTNVPVSYTQAKETSFNVNNFSAVAVLNYKVFIYDSTNDSVVNYDKVIVSPTKDGSQQVANLGANQWSENIPVTVNDFLGVPQFGGLHMKVIDLTSDLSKFRIYHTQATRIRAVPQSLEDDLATRFDSLMPLDYSPYLSGLIDVDTFVEQNTMTHTMLATEVYPYVVNLYDPDLTLMGFEWTDMNQHRFTSRCQPDGLDYDPVTAPQYCGYIRDAYSLADTMLDSVWSEMGNKTNVFVTSDHGVSSSGKSVNANFILQQAGLQIPGNLNGSKAVAYIAGGTAQVYVNLQGRNPNGVVAPGDYETVRQQIVDAFNNALSSEKLEDIMLKEETAAIPTAFGQTYNMLHPNRTGDVVVFVAPPYQFDAATPGQVIGDAPISGQHGYLPQGQLDRFAVFAAAGHDIKKWNHNDPLPIVTVLDMAPTVAEVLGISAPNNSQGVVLDILKH